MKNKNTAKPKKKIRSLHLTSTLSMSLVLFLVGLVSLLLFVARDMSVFVKENINLSIVLDDEIDQSYIKRIEKYLTTSSFAKSVDYVSKEDALKDHIASLGEDPQDFLGYNPLKASLEVKLKANYANTDSVAVIESKLKAFEHINRIAYQKDMVSLVNENVRKVSLVLLGLAIVLLIVSIALINNTVRLAVYSNRFLINTMKLVGATHWFIRKPYIIQGLLNGFVAALISLGMLAGMVYYILYEFGMTAAAVNPVSAVFVSLIVIVAGVVLTSLSSYFAVGRYLKMNTHDMYYA